MGIRCIRSIFAEFAASPQCSEEVNVKSNVEYEHTFDNYWGSHFFGLKHVMHHVLYIIKVSLAVFESFEPVNRIMTAIRAAYI